MADSNDRPFEISGRQSIDDVERELTELATTRSSSLLIPNKLKKSWVGGQAAFIQLLITWASYDRKPSLILHESEKLTDVAMTKHVEKLAGRPFGLVALAMADDVMNRQRSKSIRILAKSCLDTELGNIRTGVRDERTDSKQLLLWGHDENDLDQSPKLSGRGQTVFLPAVDHHRHWRLPQLYYTDETVRKRGEFHAVVHAALKRTTKGTPDVPVPADIISGLAAVLHELFKNTHEWARHDTNEATLLRSVRGFLFQRHSWNTGEIANAIGENSVISAFFEGGQQATTDGHIKFLEISFFDSGVGLARRWLRARTLSDLSIEEEFAACMQCLRKHRSTSHQVHKGIGLHEVFVTLSSLGAFLRVRTGRLSLFRDFSAVPFVDEDTSASADENLYDWSTGGSALVEHTEVRGTLYTMLIPISSPKKR